jgi:predicted Zn-dependent peptidase
MQYSHILANGMVLVGESMPWLESVALSFALPAGSRHDPPGRAGLASLVAEMAQRGCGERDSRQFLEDLERLGVESSGSVANAHASFGAAMIADRFPALLPMFADLVRRPQLPEDEFDDSVQSCLQEIQALDDELAQKVFHELRRRHFADPYGRTHLGTRESIAVCTLEDVQRQVNQFYQPNGAILGIAGKIDWPQVVEMMEKQFEDWKPVDSVGIVERPPVRGYEHLTESSTQTHIALAFDSVPYCDPDYYQLRGAIGVLSDGTSSRLFSEVREKRGLCYAVFANCVSLQDRGAVQAYAGTTSERAQETLDVLIAEIKKLQEGVTAEELGRLKAKMKTSLILQQESSASRAASLVADWYYLGRIQSMQELAAILDGLTAESINAYLSRSPIGKLTIVTLGEKKLEVTHGIS